MPTRSGSGSSTPRNSRRRKPRTDSNHRIGWPHVRGPWDPAGQPPGCSRPINARMWRMVTRKNPVTLTSQPGTETCDEDCHPKRADHVGPGSEIRRALPPLRQAAPRLLPPTNTRIPGSRRGRRDLPGGLEEDRTDPRRRSCAPLALWGRLSGSLPPVAAQGTQSKTHRTAWWSRRCRSPSPRRCSWSETRSIGWSSRRRPG